jgi:hypothetical protein
MNQTARFVIVMGVITAALAALGMALAGAAAASPNGVALTPTPSATPDVTVTPTPTATGSPTPIFSATLSVVPHTTTLLVGEVLTVTADLDVAAGCQYPIFELTLGQAESETPIFEHIAPPTGIITGPIAMPSAWAFRAIQPGAATFAARTFGEKNCDGAWIWQYVGGVSGVAEVILATDNVWLPIISSQD